MNFKTIAFHHFGCKVNFSEASSIAGTIQDKGITIKDFHEKADVYVISTCIVTAVAEKKCRAAIRQAYKLNPKAKIAVIGCFSELKPGELIQMEGVDLVLGNSAKFNLLEELEKLDSHCQVPQITPCDEDTDVNHSCNFIPSFSSGDRTRSFLKIQDGCDYFCSYCTIPMARGRSRSDTISHIVDSVGKISSRDIHEVVLTGINIGDFGKNTGERLIGLLHALEQTSGIERFRISSVEPDLLTDEIIDFVAHSKKFMPHFHIPLQSGSNRILRLMNRKYSTETYLSRVARILQLMPHACIAADVITGFPGETTDDFNETFLFLETLPISYMHVFSYSKRENTKAARFENPTPDHMKKGWSEKLHQLSDKKKIAFYKTNKIKVANVLFESDHDDGFIYGFTENYIRVKTSYNPTLVNTIVQLTLEKQDTNGIFIYEPKSDGQS